MRKYIQKKSLISFLMLAYAAYAGDVSICLWRGRNPEKVLSKYRNTYFGDVVVMNDKGESLIVNRIDIEDYLAGVLSKEMDSSWPVEALKAQAVVSRTFTVYTSNMNRAKNLCYDIENSIFHQVYSPSNCDKIIAAVRETRGEVLTCGGEVSQAFFHATCGGCTASPSDVWGGNSYENIVCVKDEYCENTPYCRWKKTFTTGQLSKMFSELKATDIIDRITVEETDMSGRVKLLKISLKNGNIINLTGHKFRMEINESAPKVLFNRPDIIPSTNFKVLQTGGKFVFEGAGYGHGVGMCQWGARVMAERGYDYRQILKHYFPRMEVTRID